MGLENFGGSGGGGGGVTSVDGITGAVTLVAGTNITITDNSPVAGDITISSASITPYSETPSGTINSSNVTFTLAHTPANSAGVQVILDGIVQYNGTDYTISGATITFSTAPVTGSSIYAFYNTSVGGASFVPYTGATGNVNLGTHTIIAGGATLAGTAAPYLPLAGGTMTGFVNMAGFNIVNVGNLNAAYLTYSTSVPVIDIQGTSLIDFNSALSLDWYVRRLYAIDGTTEQLDWLNPGRLLVAGASDDGASALQVDGLVAVTNTVNFPSSGAQMNFGFLPGTQNGFVQAVNYGSSNLPMVVGGYPVQVAVTSAGDISSGTANVVGTFYPDQFVAQGNISLGNVSGGTQSFRYYYNQIGTDNPDTNWFTSVRNSSNTDWYTPLILNSGSLAHEVYNDGYAGQYGFAVVNTSNQSLFEIDGNNGDIATYGSFIDTSGFTVASLNYSRTLTAADGTQMIEWQNAARVQFNANLDAGNFNLRQVNQIWDGSYVEAIDVNSRTLIDTGGSQSSVDWGGRQLNNSGNSLALDWGNRELFASGAVLAVDWQNFRLYGNDGTTLNMDWGTPGVVKLGSLNVNGSQLIINSSGKIANYGNLVMQGNGVASIPGWFSLAAKTSAQTLGSFTPVGDGSYLVSANVLVTTSTLHNFTVTASYTDVAGTSRVATLLFSNLAGTTLTAITNAAGAVPYEGIPLHIRTKGGSAITIATTGTFTTVTYNIDSAITKLQ